MSIGGAIFAMIRLGLVPICAGNGLDCLGDAVYHDGQTEEFCMDDARML